MDLAVACEQFRSAVLGQPASTVTSLAFVVAGLAVLAGRWPPPAGRWPPPAGRWPPPAGRWPPPAGRWPPPAGRWPYGLLVAAVGMGSVVQHGPHPWWQAYAHDLPLAGVLAYLAVDAASDLTGRRLSAAWWLLPSALVAPMVAAGSAASTAAQAGLGVAAIGLGVARAWRRPAVRRTVLAALVVLAAGALAGTLGDRPALCRPEALWQGHAAWHVLAAASLWWLAPVIGSRTGRSELIPGTVQAGPAGVA